MKAIEDRPIKYPLKQIAHGINTESRNPNFPRRYRDLGGIFNWDMTADSVCSNFKYTLKIAQDAGYPL
jgi:chitinase